MDFRIIYAIILSMLPISELRGGLPLAIVYANQHNIPIALIFSLIVMANIIAVFFVFFFLDKFHRLFLRIKIYKKFFDKYIEKFQKKLDKFEKKYSTTGFFALTLLVALPLPIIGGAWTGCLIAWLLDLDRKKSILSISLGIIIAGVLVLIGTLGFLKIFS
jgi:uncharacterized membrane protein